MQLRVHEPNTLARLGKLPTSNNAVLPDLTDTPAVLSAILGGPYP